MEESIVFDPLIDERSLDREASKVDQRLEQSGTITPELDDGQLGDIELDGVGGVGDGGGGISGGGGAAGAAALASKIPKPIAGVAVSAALPVALGGAVGAGMLSAMHASSARLQTSTSMLGQAWTMFWRPMGNRLDELFVRDIAKSLLSTMVEFNDVAQNEGLTVGLAWLGSKAETSFANAVGNLWEGSLESIGLDLNIGDDVSNFLQDVNWIKALTGGPSGIAVAFGNAAGEAVAKWIGNEFPTISAGNIMGALTFRPVQASLLMGALSFGVVSGADLAPLLSFAQVSSGQLVGLLEFDAIEAGQLLNAIGFPALGSGIILAELFGGLNLSADDIIDSVMGGGNGTDRPDDTGGPGGGEGDRGPAQPIPPPPEEDPTGPIVGPGAGGGMQRGGVVSERTRTTVGEAGAEVVQPLSEFERMIERVAASAGGGSEVDMQPIERKLDRLHRDLRALSDAMSSLTIEVDGETLGRAATNARHDKLFDSDSLI